MFRHRVMNRFIVERQPNANRNVFIFPTLLKYISWVLYKMFAFIYMLDMFK